MLRVLLGVDMANASKGFREFAQECIGWAKQAGDKEERQLLMDLAKQWTHAAAAVEQSIALAGNKPPPTPKSDAS
jgi:hypothetical protein